ncbi:hypothetical protein C0585_02510 [Candidatus Woesearchaeota archaeon]|nr:MAG: hypothetical protein C0585_02510 [Candidatus Woesearchaeota archaeon]
MTSIYKIQTKHLNEHSSLYGGQLLEWIDNYCLAKTERYRNKTGEKFVTRAMNCEFVNPAFLGDLIEMKVSKETIGNTSITFEYEVVSKDKMIAKGTSTFVKLYDGKKYEIII